MAYQALYRKWRPLLFSDLVGQDQVSLTLKNQLLNNSLAHAYLFSGVRGTGKTSAAKLLSRAVNCLNKIDENPCNECELCKATLTDSNMDVIEIDAASNNGVDDIRELRENVKFPPNRAKYKVYIIDEVHMLSKGAFNALLKTLEEPPSYVIFILATTEIHKVPATILSRCQRYDFKRITNDVIKRRVRYITDNIGYQIDDKAMDLIAYNSDGALRDALSLLDQCRAYSPDSLSYEDALFSMGKANEENILSLIDIIINKDIESAILKVKDITDTGKDISLFIKDLIEYYRIMMLQKTTENVTKVIDFRMDILEELASRKSLIKMDEILRIIKLLSNLESEMKYSEQPRVLLEIALIKIINAQNDLTIEGLLTRIDELELNLKSGNIASMPVQKSTVRGNDVINIPVIDISSKADSTDLKSKAYEETKSVSENIDAATENINISIDEISNKWSDLLDAVKRLMPSTHALLREVNLLRISGSNLEVAFNEDLSILKFSLSKEDNVKLVNKAIKGVYGVNLNLKVVDEDTSVKKKDDINKVDKIKEFFSGFEDKLVIK